MEPDLSKSITMHPHPFHFNIPSHLANTSQNSSQSASSNTGSEEALANATSPALEIPARAKNKKNGPGLRHSSDVIDVECQSHVPRGGTELDPYGLSCAFKTSEELAKIKANTSRSRGSRHTKIGPWCRSRQIQKYYKTQNAAIERMLKPVDDHVADARQEAGDSHLQFKIAIWGSFGASIVLAALQLYAALNTESLSLIATVADAVFDPLSNLALILSARTTKRTNPRRFPAGKSRLETVGNIILSLIIIAFAARELSDATSEGHTKDLKPEVVISVCVVFGTKLILFIYCFSLRNRYSQVRILWSDHRNALLVNGFGILTSVGGSKLRWWIDPAGAMILSMIVTILWLRTAIAEFLLLVGVTASAETQQLITYVCLTHSESI
ncbi:cation diffusion facilitator 1 [Colletotrichum camelliae]|nr:cation diffusion facilitator 1 [Colletotrichum camelliae]